MGIILKISLRNMKRRKFRYILTAVALIISVALFGGVLIVSDSFRVMMIDTIDKQLGPADVLFKPANSTDGWFNPNEVNNVVRDVSNVQYVTYRISGFDVYVSATNNGNQADNSTKTGIYGLNINDPNEKALAAQPYVIDSLNGGKTIGELLDYTQAITGNRVIVITQSLKIYLGKDFKVNDTVWILPHGGGEPTYDPLNTGTWLNYTVVAIIRDVGEAKDFDANNTDSQTSLFGASIAQGPGIFLNIQNARILSNSTINHPNEYNLGVVGINDIYSVASTKINIQKALNSLDDGLEWKTYDLKSSSLDSISTTMSTLETVFLIFGIIALILAIILMMNIFNIIRKEQEYETGMFQAIGASKSETFRMFLTQGLIMGVIGALIGTISSYFIAYLIFSVVIQSLQALANAFGGLTISTFNIILLPQTILFTFFVGLASCIIASIYPSWKASRKPIIECLNPIEEKSERFKKHYLRRIFLFILGAILIGYGYFLTNTAPPVANTVFSSGSSSSGVVVGMFAPMLILFGIIWEITLCLKPINKVVVNLFKPYLRRTKLLTENNILRHRRRTALTFIMIALTTSFLVGISTLMSSISAGVETSVNDFMGTDIRIYTLDTPKSFESGLSNQPGVADVMGVTHQNTQFLLGSNWIGHSSLDSNYSESIIINVLDTAKIKDHMKNTIILSPSTLTLDGLMDDIENGNNIIIMKDIADKYGIKVGDVIPVKFSLGISYANISMLFSANTFNAQEETVTVNMSVSAIIQQMQGFSTNDLLGLRGQKIEYNVFISWSTYDKIAIQNLPGGGTDLMIRQMGNTGNLTLDKTLPNWFNFSDVEGILDGAPGVEYYTSRMDYFTTSLAGGLQPVPFSSVVGIHTNSSGKLRSDAYFGNNTIIEGSASTIEELLNTTENVCVVDERYISAHSLGINDNITLIPTAFNDIYVPVTSSNTHVDISSANYSSYMGGAENMTFNDNSYASYISNRTSLAFNITTTLEKPFLYHLNIPILVNITTKVNGTVDNLKLEALNQLTNSFDTLGSINNTVEGSHVFTFDVSKFYTDPFTSNITLRIVGMNSTYNGDYNLSINSMSFYVSQSNETINNFPKFKIVGITKAPTYYNTERYNWVAGTEAYYDVSEDYPIYISYEHARDSVYTNYRGSDMSNDNVTYILVHCNDVENITAIKSSLLASLNNLSGPQWTAINIKSETLKTRMNVYDWFVWIKSGTNDETVLNELLGYIEDSRHLVIYSFTKSFMRSTFNGIINLIIFISNSLLIFCIIIAMIGLVLHSLLTTMARRREIGMLRSIGLSRHGVIRSISGETYILSVLGLATGIISGLILGRLMVDTMPTGGFLAVTFTIPLLTIIYLVIAVIMTVIISSRFPARWAARLNIIDAVRTR